MAESSAERTLKNLFSPGDGGGIPPYLAGRLEEQAWFRNSIERLLMNTPLGNNMIVYGPRGNGKTTMLRYLQKKTLKETGSGLEILWVTPSEFVDLGELAGLIVGNDQDLSKKAWELFRPLFDNFAASASIGLASVNTTLNRPKATLALKALLREKSRKRPFVLIIDEAHTLDLKVGKTLLNASQSLRGEDCPFFLVLAGTPNLETVLSQQASATFWSRSEIFPLGRLSSEEAQEALTIPLKRHQVTCADGVISEVVSRARRYPYFIQIWGDCIANQLHDTGVREVTMDTVREIEEKATAKCTEMYRDRYNELLKQDLRPLAIPIAREFTETGKKNIGVNEMIDLVKQVLDPQDPESVTDAKAMRHLEPLFQIGYIWQINVPGEVKGEDPLLCYEPGIPSLMQYVRRQSLS